MFVRTNRERSNPARIRPRDIIYIWVEQSAGRGSGGLQEREREDAGLTATMLVVPQVMVTVEAAASVASMLRAPGHDSRAPVFEYNALYCPRHIIYLAAK